MWHFLSWPLNSSLEEMHMNSRSKLALIRTNEIVLVGVFGSGSEGIKDEMPRVSV